MLAPWLLAQTPVAAGYVGPLDIQSGAALAFSQRRLSSSFSSNVIQINNGSATQDFAASTNNAVDQAAIVSFIAGGSSLGAKWYDQSGNANDAAQANASIQPVWVSNQINGAPILRFDSVAESQLNSGSNITLGGSGTIFIVLSVPSDTTFITGAGSLTAPGNAFFNVLFTQGAPGVIQAQMYAVTTGDPQAETTGYTLSLGFHLIEIVLDDFNAPFGGPILVNGTTIAIVNNGDGGWTGNWGRPFTFGASDSTSAASSDGDIAEYLLYLSVVDSSKRSQIRQNIAAYYGIVLP